MSQAAAINETNFQSEVLESDVPVVVDMWAEWCRPCHMLAPILDEVAVELGDKVKFVKVNVDENPNLSQQFGVMSIPTLLFFKEGKPVGQTVGVLKKQVLLEKIEEVFEVGV